MSEDERAELQAVATIAAGLMAHYASNSSVSLTEIREFAWEVYDVFKLEQWARRRADLVPEGPNLRDAIDAGMRATDQSHQQRQT